MGNLGFLKIRIWYLQIFVFRERLPRNIGGVVIVF
jgi:hypothetical protein